MFTSTEPAYWFTAHSKYVHPGELVVSVELAGVTVYEERDVRGRDPIRKVLERFAERLSEVLDPCRYDANKDY